jgi:hypothetical protein
MKTRRNRIQIWLLCAAMLSAVVRAQDYTYITNGDDTITITRYIGSGTDVTIPDKINNLLVTGIGSGAFANLPLSSVMLTSIAIPDSVTSIGNGAFANTALSSVTIPNTVTNLGDLVFSGCASLSSVTIGTNVTSIGNNAFDWCISLVTVILPHSVSSIGNFAFFHCHSMTSVTIGNSVNTIGDWAFGECDSLTNASIPNDVISIGNWAFFSCSSLNNVTIPDGVSSIGNQAFYNCSSLTSVTIPKSTTNIGSYVFVDCTGLKAITVDALNSAYSGVDGVLFDKSLTTLIQYPGGKTGIYAIPDNISSIESDAFYHCSYLTAITIPRSVSYIGDGAFKYCNSLTGIYFRGNAPSFGSDVFYDDNEATAYYLPGTTGWDTTFGGLPTALWFLPNPTILNFEPNFGIQTNCFGFTISWATNIPVVVTVCTNLSQPIWLPVATNTLTDGTFFFSDSQWTNCSVRFYRLRSL